MMQMHAKTGTTSIVNRLLLLVVVAGILNVDLPERSTASDHGDHKILHRIALVLDAARPSFFPVLFISKAIPGNNTAACVFGSNFRSTCLDISLLVLQDTGTVNNRPFYVSHNHTRLFNIPHQNSDEDNVFILPLGVA